MSFKAEVNKMHNSYKNWNRYNQTTKHIFAGSMALASFFGMMALYDYEQEAGPRTQINDIYGLSSGNLNQPQAKLVSEATLSLNYQEGNVDRNLELGGMDLAVGLTAAAVGEFKRNYR